MAIERDGVRKKKSPARGEEAGLEEVAGIRDVPAMP